MTVQEGTWCELRFRGLICESFGKTDSLTADHYNNGQAARLRSEAFGAAELDEGEPFTVNLARSGIKLEVPAGVSLLEALENAGKNIPNMCRKGICGECTLQVLRGRPQHRDLYLSDQEKAENTTMTCCVSRSLDEELELDL